MPVPPRTSAPAGVLQRNERIVARLQEAEQAAIVSHSHQRRCFNSILRLRHAPIFDCHACFLFQKHLLETDLRDQIRVLPVLMEASGDDATATLRSSWKRCCKSASFSSSNASGSAAPSLS
jgi:hypothetical protein